ncbi:MAG: hypothetical protein WAM82_22910 [Thermoanaerobaculia bacterium]
MATVPLLPKPKVQDWPHQAEVGLHGVSDLDYQRNLCENYFDASDFGTPSPLANALVFANRLDQYLLDLQGKGSRLRFSESFELWSLILKGIYLGLITPRDVKLEDLKELGLILHREFESFESGFRFQFLTYSGSVIGFTYPGIGFAPASRLRPETLASLKEAVQAKDVEKASEYFVGWVRTFDEQDQGRLPFYTLVYRLAAVWNPDASGSLPREPARLFGVGPVLRLGEAGLAAEVSQPQIPLYIGTPIVCENCGFDITTETGQVDIAHPDECRCPHCGARQNWLEEYATWIKFDEGRNRYLIYAFADSPVRRLPYSKYVSYEQDGIVLQTGKFSLKIRGLILTEDALKCTRLIFFQDPQDNSHQYEPSLPVRGEYYGLVSIADDRRAVMDRLSGDYIVPLKVNVEGWKSTTITLRYSPKEIQKEEAILLSWPRFNLRGWNVYYYLLESTPGMNKAGITLRSLDTHGEPTLLTDRRGQLTQPFEAFEIVFSKDGKIESQSGIYETSRVEQHRGQTPVTISLDFGTSSSSVWYRIGDDAPKVIRFRDFTETLIGNRTISDRIIRTSQWLPTYRIDDEETVRSRYFSELQTEDGVAPEPIEIIERMNYFIPSELVVTPPVSAEMLNKPIGGFRILHVYVSEPQGEVIYELKTLDEKGDAAGRFTYEQAVSRYLELFLVLTLATIIAEEPRTGFLKVRASFPRAFSQAKLKTYLQCLDRVLKSLDRLTGFPTNTQHFIDESRAAAFSLRVPEGLSLVVDMGGGTTDIGMFEWDQSELKPIFIDSLLYGGNAFLRLLADDRQADLFPKPTETRDARHRLLWLLRETRLRGFETVVRTQYRGNAHARQVMIDLLIRFYSPIAHFIRCLFDSLSVHRQKDYRQEEVTFYLVGNGWSLADVVPSQDSNYRAGFREVFRFLLEREGFTKLTAAREPSLGNGITWPGPKAAIGYGTIIAAERDLYRSIEDVGNGVNGVRSVVGFDVRYSNGSGKREDVPWHEVVPHQLSDSRLHPVLSEIKLPPAWDFIQFEKGAEVQALERECNKDIVNIERPLVNRSILVRFLETIYLKQLYRARRL